MRFTERIDTTAGRTRSAAWPKARDSSFASRRAGAGGKGGGGLGQGGRGGRGGTRAEASAHELSPNLDFLPAPAPLLANLLPDAQGIVRKRRAGGLSGWT